MTQCSAHTRGSTVFSRKFRFCGSLLYAYITAFVHGIATIMEQEVFKLKQQLVEREREISVLKDTLAQLQTSNISIELQEEVTALAPLKEKVMLSNEDVMRYSQLKLSQASVLVVGCGGLGCPLAQYLAAAGIGRLGLLDYDEVELSNLHRQVLHGEQTRGQPKALSAAQAIRRLNPAVECIPYHLRLSHENALQLIQQYDIVADCSDNVPTRYLVNDACVLAGKPLVSASALRMEGQLTVYNYEGGPCYRCLYPVPPPPETVTNCSDGGVLGVVPGIMGCFQALEVLKIASGQASSCSQQLLTFDAQDVRFRSIRLRPRQAGCAVCGEKPTVTALKDYETFCGTSATDKCRRLCLLSKEQRISVQEYKEILGGGTPHLLLDVRPLVEVDICHLPFSLSIPLASLEDRKTEDVQLLKERIVETKQQLKSESCVPVYAICKTGNDSQKAVQILQQMAGSELEPISAKDVKGGLMAWAQKIDPSFPQY
ncbi:adenylyltransferase and sulfurtransferase MOCS3 isoform X2 [Conger conger]|uniref:adenylyltransferase and sulfurtransferase MOCS3 isoform X2 n=1 Tax=Conger conger TaxID=82655 RepID=UPI002A5AA146|nr:adenylyltransferase and sulfurtransferase MOCS3 isoform X2 [Conger conger]